MHVRFSHCSTDIRLTYGNLKKLEFDAGNVCRTPENEIIFLEHVEIEVNLEYSRRGALQMHLAAPSGTYICDFSSVYNQSVTFSTLVD